VSLRARLVLVATAAVAFAVVLASVIVYFLVRNELRAQVDRSLQEQAVQIPQLPGAPFQNLVSPGQYAIHVRGDPFGGLWQLIDESGNVYRPEEFDTLPPLLPGVSQARLVAQGKRGSFFSETTLNGTHLRLFTTRYQSDAPGAVPIAVEVAGQLTPVDRELGKIRLWLILVAAGGVGIASLAGFLVARASLKPVRELSETAERVRATRDLTQRIAVEGNDELSRLAFTFNAMLESLDEAAQRQQQLVQDASHELRTPLTSLRTNIEVLARGDELPPHDREQLLRDVVDQLGEMTALISELTELARGEEQAAALEEVRLDLVAEEAIRRTARNHPDVPIEAELDETSVVGLPASLERAIANLLDNAAKWSPPGSPVEVRLAGNELTVRDHGPGIAQADVPHIFERFYRATSARSMPGSGLGLAIVQKVAESHGGTIVAEPAPGGGTLMRLQLPERNGSAPLPEAALV
jgi:two-component system, OmpR family, sensor histidine kinase MprB